MSRDSQSQSTSVLLGLSASELETWAKDHGQSAFRGRQIHQWLYQKGAKDLNAITVLPKDWRLNLIERGVQIGRLKELDRVVAADETMKMLLATSDSQSIETVGIPTSSRLTVCVSSQIGCPMDCHFCATGKEGLQRSLKVNEIIDQVISIREAIGRRPTHIVFMGMGEPMLNLHTVLNSIRCINDDLGIGQRRITISTVGVPNTLSALSSSALEILGRAQFTLAISLHAPNQELRESLIPSAKLYPIDRLLEDCREYLSVTKRRLTFEYILLGGCNDHLTHAEELGTLLKGFQSHVNLITYNPIDNAEFKRPSMSQVNAFRDKLASKGIAVSIRSSRGSDKNAACGQLRRQKKY